MVMKKIACSVIGGCSRRYKALAVQSDDRYSRTREHLGLLEADTLEGMED